MPRRIRFLCLILTLAAAAALPAAAPAEVVARPGGYLVPNAGSLLGAYVNTDGGPWTSAELEDFQTLIGRKVAIDNHYHHFLERIPDGPDKYDVATGITPMLTWGGRDDFPANGIDDINSGLYDAWIQSRADSVKALGVPVFIRLFWEMNGRWMPWNGSTTNDPGTTDGPAKFVQAWRHIHDLFDQEGATNVAWVWCPDITTLPKEDWNNFRNYYPGNAYVDWVCADGYNRGSATSWSEWLTWSELFGELYRLTRRSSLS